MTTRAKEASPATLLPNQPGYRRMKQEGLRPAVQAAASLFPSSAAVHTHDTGYNLRKSRPYPHDSLHVTPPFQSGSRLDAVSIHIASTKLFSEPKV